MKKLQEIRRVVKSLNMDVSRARLETMNWRMEAVADLSSIQNNSSYKLKSIEKLSQLLEEKLNQ